MSSSSGVPAILEYALKTLEPSTSFGGRPPHITSASGKAYYAKLGEIKDVEQFAGEAESLKVFSAISPGIAPNVLINDVDEASGRPYMVSDYLDMSGRLNDASAKVLAKRLALEVHAHSSMKGYGFDVSTFCGATRFENTWCSTWDKAFGGMIESLLDRIGDEELSRLGNQVLARYV